jgi:hypothetical protein
MTALARFGLIGGSKDISNEIPRSLMVGHPSLRSFEDSKAS